MMVRRRKSRRLIVDICGGEWFGQNGQIRMETHTEAVTGRGK